MTSCSRSDRALLRSQAGLGAGRAFATAPTAPETTMAPERFQALIRRRLRWPLPLTSLHCEGCGRQLDDKGDHFGACMATGRVKLRAMAIEHAVARICREAGARVRTNVKLRDLIAAFPAGDDRAIEVKASGLSAFGGAQLAVDVARRSPLSRNGWPRPKSDWQNVACLRQARHDKEARYPELASGEMCRLL